MAPAGQDLRIGTRAPQLITDYTRDVGRQRTHWSGLGAFTVDRLDHLVLSVASLEASARFYETICGMRRITFDGGRVAMVFGAHKLNLNERAHDVPAPSPLDFCLTTNRTADEVLAHVRSHGITEMLGPVRRSGARGPMLSVYVLDPDRNIVELASYWRATRPDDGEQQPYLSSGSLAGATGASPAAQPRDSRKRKRQ